MTTPKRNINDNKSSNICQDPSSSRRPTTAYSVVLKSNVPPRSTTQTNDFRL